MRRRLTAWVLTAGMILSLLPAPVAAAGTPLSAETAGTESASGQKTADAKGDAAKEQGLKEGTYAPGEALVLWDTDKKGMSLQSCAGALGDGLTVETLFDSDEGKAHDMKLSAAGEEDDRILVSRVSSDKESTEELMKTLKKRDDIKLVEPNYYCYAQDIADDSYKDYQWHLKNTGAGGESNSYSLRADKAWNKMEETSVTGDAIVIAVLDTGVDYRHEDLKDRMWDQKIPGLAGVHGYDFCNKDADPMDDNSHGTHCAGIIAAATENGVGVAGVAGKADVKIMALKYLSADNMGYLSDAILAYGYLQKALEAGVPIAAVNNSWGGGSHSNLFRIIMNKLGEEYGTLSIIAAGNDSLDLDEKTVDPAKTDSPYTITVAAADEDGSLASYSNYGKQNVDVAAPGSNILSTVNDMEFAPALYGEKRDSLVSAYREFSKDMSLNPAAGDPGWDNYSFGADPQGDVPGTKGFESVNVSGGALSIETEGYLGNKVNEKGTDRASLAWTIDGKAGKTYRLVFPYSGVGGTGLYLNAGVKTKMLEESDNYAGWVDLEELRALSDGGWQALNTEEVIAAAVKDQTSILRSPFTWARGEFISGKSALGLTYHAYSDEKVTIYINNIGVSRAGVSERLFGKYGLKSGTSMATPAVVGTVAVLKALDPTLDGLKLKAKLLTLADRTLPAAGYVSAGVIDLGLLDDPNPAIADMVASGGAIHLEGVCFGGEQGRIRAAAVSAGAVQRELSVSAWSDTDIVFELPADLNGRIVQIEVETKPGKMTEFCRYMVLDKEGYTYETVTALGSEPVMTSDGETLYYIDNYSSLLSYRPGEGEMPLSQMPFDEIEETMGFMPGNYIDAMTFMNLTYMDGRLYVLGYLAAGYEVGGVLCIYDLCSEEWSFQKVLFLDEKVDETWFGLFAAAAWRKDLYYFGLIMDKDGKIRLKMCVYRTESGEWEISDLLLPQGHEEELFSYAGVYRDKLYLMMGNIYKEEEDVWEFDQNVYVYDGTAWTVDGTLPQPLVKNASDGEESNMMYVGAADVCKQGFLLTGLSFDGYGDTVIYAPGGAGEEAVSATEYNFCRQLCDSKVFGAAAGDLFYTISLTGLYDNLHYVIQSVPIESAFPKVTAAPSDYGTLAGANRHYRPGDTVTLNANAEDGYCVKAIRAGGIEYKGDTAVFVIGEDDVQAEVVFAAKEEEKKPDKEPQKDTIKPVSSLTIKNKDPKLTYGKTLSLVTQITPSDAAEKTLTYKCSNTKYAAVDKNGKVTAMKAGIGKTVTVTVTAEGGKVKASVRISIINPVKKLTIAKCASKLKAKKSLKLKVKINPTNATDAKLTFKSSNKKYAVVDKNGKVTAKKAGIGKTVTITVTAANGKKAAKKIKIIKG